jgi:hypothetical protein
MNPGVEAACRLVNLGYRPHMDGEGILLKWEGRGRPDRATVEPLLKLVLQHRDQVQIYLKTMVACQDCAHAQVGERWALCQAEPWDRIPRQVPDYPHPCRSFTRREKPLPPPERILRCNECSHFRPEVNSPNPTQAWGHCRKLDRGRYGVAMGCEVINFSSRDSGLEG